MGKFSGTKIAENRQYENPSDPANSNFTVIFEVTAPEAVIDPVTRKTLKTTLEEKDAEIAAAAKAATDAQTAANKAQEAVNNAQNTSITVEDALSSTSTNPVQNKVVNKALEAKFPKTGGTISGDISVTGNISATGNISGAKVYNAVWNADYAEGFDYEGAAPKPGEIVELCGNNKVRVAAAASDMVIGVCSDTYWALAGCHIDDIKRGVKVAVGIAGQLPIKVRGAVKYGDYIVCGGDGIGEARDKPILGQTIGRAMESNASSEIKDVNCIIQIR